MLLQSSPGKESFAESEIEVAVPPDSYAKSKTSDYFAPPKDLKSKRLDKITRKQVIKVTQLTLRDVSLGELPSTTDY